MGPTSHRTGPVGGIRHRRRLRRALPLASPVLRSADATTQDLLATPPRCYDAAPPWARGHPPTEFEPMPDLRSETLPCRQLRGQPQPAWPRVGAESHIHEPATRLGDLASAWSLRSQLIASRMSPTTISDGPGPLGCTKPTAERPPIASSACQAWTRRAGGILDRCLGGVELAREDSCPICGLGCGHRRSHRQQRADRGGHQLLRRPADADAAGTGGDRDDPRSWPVGCSRIVSTWSPRRGPGSRRSAFSGWRSPDSSPQPGLTRAGCTSFATAPRRTPSVPALGSATSSTTASQFSTRCPACPTCTCSPEARAGNACRAPATSPPA